MIDDESWFFRSWKLDPTIQSALTMLDAIHKQFASRKGFYDKLVRADRPYITFQLLNLKTFGLSDELYIKMNARGQALTAFETFKAKLEQKLDGLFPVEKMTLHGKQDSVKAYFSDRIDRVWADMFWNYRDSKNLFDEQIMNLLRALAIVTRNPDQKENDAVLEQLRDKKQSFSFFKYEEYGCIDRELVETFIFVLDMWCNGRGGIETYLHDAAYYDERGIFKKVINDATEVTYAELIQFHAYCAYIRKNRADIQPDLFWEWMRVVKNLSENTRYDRLDDFTRSIRSVNKLVQRSNRILDHFSEPNAEVQGFNEQQIREEKLKAQLIRRSKEWTSLILNAEQHGYFNGQIEFLLTFSRVLERWAGNNSSDWSEEDDAGYRQAFSNYFAKSSMVFSADGLNDFGEYRWERALLVIGDYLLPQGNSGNYSFLVNSHRDLSWKRLLQGGVKADDFFEVRRRYVQDLFDQIDLKAGVTASLDSVIGQRKPMKEWLRVVVEMPEMIEFCENRLIRWESDNCVYLLKKVRMSGAHAELFSYHLYGGLLWKKQKKGELAPFGVPHYHEQHTDSEQPYAYLHYDCADGIIALNVSNKNGEFELKLFNRDRALPAKLKDAAKRKAAFADQDGETISRTVDSLKIEEAINNVVSAVREYANTPTP